MNDTQQNAIIFVGGPGHSMLRKVAGHPVCLLPIPGGKSLLHSWIDVLKTEMNVESISLVTGRLDDVPALEQQVLTYQGNEHLNISVHADQSSHRGTAGALKDFIDERPHFRNLLFIEGNRIPPEYPRNLFCKDFIDDEVVGVLGRTARHETAGMILMKREMIEDVPTIGFFDFKEQLIPRTIESGSRILVKEISRQSIRLSTPSAYLKQLIEFEPLKEGECSGPFISDSAQIDPTVVLGRHVIVGADVRIEARCLIQDSVILEGSRVGADSTLIRSIVTRDSMIERGTSSVTTPHDLNMTRPTAHRRRVS